MINKVLFIFFLLLTAQLSAEGIIFKDMKEHKKRFLEEIMASPKTIDPLYPLARVKLTINADDADYIPKVLDAGKIIEEKGLRYQLMFNGIKVLLDSYYGSWMTDIIYGLRGHHEPQEEKVFYEVLKYIPPNATMIELGSYWGYYSLWFSKMIPGAKNFLIEPDVTNMEIGKKHFAMNGKNAHFTLGYIFLLPTDPQVFKSAKNILLDHFMIEHKLDHLDIVHSDIQGAEFNMLLTCQNAIKNHKIDYFFISTHGYIVHKKCRDFLLANNYLIIAEHLLAESCSADGLIVARRKNMEGPLHIEIKKYKS